MKYLKLIPDDCAEVDQGEDDQSQEDNSQRIEPDRESIHDNYLNRENPES